MEILRVAPWLYPDTYGGGEYHVHAMSRDQAAMGHDVTVVTTKEEGALPHQEETEGYEVVRLSKGRTVVGNDISAAMARYLWHHVNEYDVIHAHSHLYFSTNLAALVRRLNDVPLAITNHGLYSQSAPEQVFRWYLKTLGQWTFDQADVVFCYTEVDRQRVRELGVNSRIEVVPNGIDTGRFTPAGPESGLIDAAGPVVLFVGRFAEGKRPWLAVEAFAAVLSEYPNAELYLCGDGPLREDLEAQVEELGIGESVTFLGHVSYDEMPKVYRSGDVFVLPSRAEGVPRTVLEAIASGLNIVLSDLDQVTSVLGNQAYVVADDRGDSFANGLLKAIGGLSEVSEQIEPDDHRWTDTVERTTRILRSISENN